MPLLEKKKNVGGKSSSGPDKVQLTLIAQRHNGISRDIKTDEKDRKKITGTETRCWSERRDRALQNPRSVNVHKISDFLLVSIS